MKPSRARHRAGRRIRSTLTGTVGAAGIDTVVVAGMANAYALYMTTREEYSRQYFEGSSTLFGPWAAARVFTVQ